MPEGNLLFNLIKQVAGTVTVIIFPSEPQTAVKDVVCETASAHMFGLHHDDVKGS